VGGGEKGGGGDETEGRSTTIQKKKTRSPSPTHPPSFLSGYKQRFGLTYVDYKTQTRYPKASFDYVSQLWGNPPSEWPLKGGAAAAPATAASG